MIQGTCKQYMENGYYGKKIHGFQKILYLIL